MLFSASIRGITLSIGVVDSTLMLWVAPAESAFSMDRGQPSLFKGRLRPQLDNDFLSRVRLCWDSANAVPRTAALR